MNVTLGHIWSACVVLMILTLGRDQLLAKDMIPTPADTPILGELEPILIDALLKNNKDPDASLATIRKNPKLRAMLAKHNIKLFGGPMLGSVTHNSARFWVRTPDVAQVQVIASSKSDSGKSIQSQKLKTSVAMDLTAVLALDGLEPFTHYQYDVLVNGESVFGGRTLEFRTSPAPGQKAKFDVGFGGGARLVPKNEHIWETISRFKPAAFLFLGDNVYIDKPKQRNLQRLYYYRRQLRPEFRKLGSQTAFYSIWDDHDFGVNDSSGGLDPFKPDWKVPVWKVFKENWNNPGYGGGPKQPGCWYKFSMGDVEFFMTDGRYYRSFKDGTMLGPVQKKWLLDSLKASKATFKVIASGTLWTETADKGGKDSWWGVKEEREEIFGLIDRQKIGGVILLSADRHRTDVYQIKRPNGYTLYEFETSKLTNLHTHGTKKEAIFSYNKGNFFGMLTFDLTPADPTVTFRCITIEGKTVYTLTLKRSKLQTP